MWSPGAFYFLSIKEGAIIFRPIASFPAREYKVDLKKYLKKYPRSYDSEGLNFLLKANMKGKYT